MNEPAPDAARRPVADPEAAAWPEDEADEERSTAAHGGLWRKDTFRRHRTWWLVGGAFVLVGALLATWFSWSATRGVMFTNTGFDVRSDQQIVVQFDVTREPHRDVICVLRAQAVDHSSVGWVEARVPGTAERSIRHRAELRTSARPVTGFVESCRYA